MGLQNKRDAGCGKPRETQRLRFLCGLVWTQATEVHMYKQNSCHSPEECSSLGAKILRKDETDRIIFIEPRSESRIQCPVL